MLIILVSIFFLLVSILINNKLFFILFLVSKPNSNNNSSNNLSHIPPPRPAPPTNKHDPPIFYSSKEYKDDCESPDEVETRTEPPTAEFDFLNLSSEKSTAVDPASKQMPKVKEPSFDLLGGFDSNFSDPFPDLVGSAMNKPTTTTEAPILVTSSSNSNLDDIFGSLPQSNFPTMAPSKSSSDLNGVNFNFGNAPKNTTATAKSQENVKRDPFADLTQSMHPEFNSNTFSKSTSQNPFSGATPMMQGSSTNTSPRNNPSTPIHQMKNPGDAQKPDYSRSHFQEPSQQGQQGSQKSKPEDIFGDILGQQGYSFGKTTTGPKSINEMRKVELAQTMDPEKLKVSEWVIYFNFRFLLKKLTLFVVEKL